jgi:hypothetical protein
MDSHIWRPHSVVDDSLSEVPFLEEITSVLLMSWMDLWEVDHLFHEFGLFETLVNQEIVLLMHSSVATLASSLPNLETSSESLGVEGVPGELGRPVTVSVMHTNGVDLLFVTFDTVRGTNVISEKPGFSFLVS